MENIDSVLYVDTDTIFLASPTKVWDHFTKMSSAHLAALTPEHEDSSTGWYNRFARHPYYGNLGTLDYFPGFLQFKLNLNDQIWFSVD